MSNLAVAQKTGITINNPDDLDKIAKMMAASGFFADAKDVAKCAVKIMAGLELGMPTFASMTGIHIIQGRPAMGANLMAAAIKRSGKYDYRVTEHSADVCKIAFFESGEQIGVSEFTAADAKTAGTQHMNKFPKNMLFARAISNGIKWFCPDLFLGPVYTPEELGAEVDGEGNVLQVETVDVMVSTDHYSDNQTWQAFADMLTRANSEKQVRQAIDWLRKPGQWVLVQGLPDIEQRIDAEVSQAIAALPQENPVLV